MDIKEIQWLIRKILNIEDKLEERVDRRIEKRREKKLKNISQIYQNTHIVPTKVCQIDFTKKEKLKKYVDILLEVLPEEDLKNLYRNINDVDVKRKIRLLFLASSGNYDCCLNNIDYLVDSSISHELLHLASSQYFEKSEVVCSGFFQGSIDGSIGLGITEGATDYYNKKIFQEKYCSDYNIIRRNYQLLNLLDDEEELRDLYFQHNLNGLIELLSKYTSSDEAINFIIDNDYYEKILIDPVMVAKTQFTLYNWLLDKGNREKEEEFREILKENYLYYLIFLILDKKISIKDACDIEKEVEEKERDVNKVYYK